MAAQDGALCRVYWTAAPLALPVAHPSAAVLRAAVRQMRAYDAGDPAGFDLPLCIPGTPFQRAVCAAISAIGHGETRTYGQLAQDLGVSAQAVGRACGANPLPIVVPCHRVLGRRGLTGYSGAGGIETKVALLRHEGAGGLLI